MNSVVAASEIGFRVATLVIGSPGSPPAYRGVVVVRSRVDHLAPGAMWQIHARAFVAKAELQHGHPRNLQAVAQGVNLRRDIAQILRKEWQRAQGFTQLVKQVIPRTIHPASVDRGGVGRWNLPELVEPAEMIEADVVTIPRRPA